MSLCCGQCRRRIGDRMYQFLYKLERLPGQRDVPPLEYFGYDQPNCAVCTDCIRVLPDDIFHPNPQELYESDPRHIFAITCAPKGRYRERKNYKTQETHGPLLFIEDHAVLQHFPTPLRIIQNMEISERTSRILALAQRSLKQSGLQYYQARRISNHALVVYDSAREYDVYFTTDEYELFADVWGDTLDVPLLVPYGISVLPGAGSFPPPQDFDAAIEFAKRNLRPKTTDSEWFAR